MLFRLRSGTSQSVPFVAGVIAMYYNNYSSELLCLHQGAAAGLKPLVQLSCFRQQSVIGTLGWPGPIYDLMTSLAGASPAEIESALASAGSWSQISEPSASGPFNALVLQDTPNILLNSNLFKVLNIQPEAIQVRGPLV